MNCFYCGGIINKTERDNVEEVLEQKLNEFKEMCVACYVDDLSLEHKVIFSSLMADYRKNRKLKQ